MTAFAEQPCFISTQCFNKSICDEAVCREGEHESIGDLGETEVLVRSELRVCRVWLWKVVRWGVEDGKDHQQVLNDLKSCYDYRIFYYTGLLRFGDQFLGPKRLGP